MRRDPKFWLNHWKKKMKWAVFYTSPCIHPANKVMACKVVADEGMSSEGVEFIVTV
jgi:hypothetical protein